MKLPILTPTTWSSGDIIDALKEWVIIDDSGLPMSQRGDADSAQGRPRQRDRAGVAKINQLLTRMAPS